jgi:plastocyanin
MRRSALLVAAIAVTALPQAPARAQASARVVAMDDAFEPANPQVPVGTTVTFVNEGDNPHTVTADDLSFDSGSLAPGDSFTVTLDDPGRMPFFCEYHGAPGGFGMAGTVLVGGATAGEQPEAVPPPEPGTGRIIRVPQDHRSIQKAVDAARPGDLILVAPGVYREAVRVTTPYLTIRGLDRNGVVLEGDFERPNGIHVLDADGVTVENMTARHYLLNGFYWIGVDGYRGSYLTAYNNGDYGVYAFDSVHGQFDRSYASGHPDSGFYIGQCDPCHALVLDVLAENNGLGWSGTNASGDLVIAGSEWRNNMSGIVPNTLDSEALPPQRGQTIVGNWVHDNNNGSAPAKPGTYPAFGTGIALAGGLDNVITRNLVEDHDRYGIVAFPNIDRNLWIPGGNRVEGNVIRGSGLADLALGAPAAGENCFGTNDYGSSLPPGLELLAGCARTLTGGGGGDLSVSTSFLSLFAEGAGGSFPRGDWRTMAPPPPQPTMPGAATSPPAPAVDVPQPFDLAAVRMPPGDGSGGDVDPEVTVLGVGVAGPGFWSLLVSLYAYVLPLVLYASWVSIALWDLIRRDDVAVGRRAAWMAIVLVVPVLGPVAYYTVGDSRIPGVLRLMLVVGGLIVYAGVAALAFTAASS